MNMKLAVILCLVLLGSHACSVHGGLQQLEEMKRTDAYTGPPLILCVRNRCDGHTCWCCATMWPGRHCWENQDDCLGVCPHK